MQKFLALYMAPAAAIDDMMKNMSKEKAKEGMDEWQQWMDAHKADLVDQGTPVGKNKRVTVSGVQDMRNEVIGYSIVQADSHDAAAKLFEGMGHLKLNGAYVEVMPLVDMSKM